MSDEEKNEYTATTVVQTNGTTVRQNPIDFAKLQKINSDVVAWIKVENCDIDFPVVRPTSVDDSYYLMHTYKKEYSSAGAIYMEHVNTPDFSDSVTVLYGHNWVNNGYFRPLYNFRDADFFNKNDKITVYLPNKILTYKIYSAYRYDNRHIINSFDFGNEKVREDYFDYTLNPKSIDKNTRSGVELNKDSKILTLSTCVQGVKSARYLVNAVRISEEETN